MQLILMAITYTWLFLVLLLLWLIWRTSSKHIHHMELTLFEAAQRSAHAAHEASETARALAETIRKLVERST